MRPAGSGVPRFRGSGVLVRGAGVLVLGVLLAAGAGAAGRQIPAPASTFVLHINQQIDPADLVVTTYHSWPGGGYSNYGMRAPNLKMRGSQDILIDTQVNGNRATRLRVVVYCRGYRFAMIEAPDLSAVREQSVDLLPLSTVTLRGRIAIPRVEPASLKVIAEYDAESMVWDFFFHDFRGGMSFPYSPFEIASTTGAADGSFAIDIPDFLRDASVAAHPGQLMLLAKTSADRVYRLVAPGQAGNRLRGMPLATSYPQELGFELDDR